LGKNNDPAKTSSSKPSKGYTWHHQDGKTMVLVEQEVHTKFKHQGGASIIQKK